MINLFNNSYDEIFKNWYRMRLKLEDKNTKIKCIEVDKWWQKVPLVNHYLHMDYIHEWPNPWELLAENHYCQISRGLGIFYTLILLGVKDIEFVVAKDYNNDEVLLVLVDNAKYILNYWPDSVVNNNLADFKIIKYLDTSTLITKVGQK